MEEVKEQKPEVEEKQIKEELLDEYIDNYIEIVKETINA